MMRIVELKTAYHWHCDECAAENFALPQKAELTQEEREEAFREVHQLEEWAELPEGWENFELVHIPKVVTCTDCGAEFLTMDERSESE